MTESTTTLRQQQADRLEIRQHCTVSRFTCHYKTEWTDEVGHLDVCQVHGERSYYSFKFGPNRPCINASLSDKKPLTLLQFLRDRAADPSVSKESATIIYLVVNFYEDFPTLMTTEPKFDLPVPGPGNQRVADTITYQVSQKIEWLTTKEYRKRFGEEPPVAPIMRQIASIWKDDPDWREEWQI